MIRNKFNHILGFTWKLLYSGTTDCENVKVGSFFVMMYQNNQVLSVKKKSPFFSWQINLELEMWIKLVISS